MTKRSGVVENPRPAGMHRALAADAPFHPVVLGDASSPRTSTPSRASARPSPSLPPLANRWRRSYEFLRRLATSDVAVYGLTTGCGPLAGQRIDAAQRQAIHATSSAVTPLPWGAPPHRDGARRDLVRAQVFAQGRSGVARQP